MAEQTPLDGQLQEGDIFAVLYHIYKHSISGLLSVKHGEFEKQMVVRDRKAVFATSTLKADAFGEYLLKKHVISREVFNQTTQYMLENDIRFGRALIEQGYLNYDQIWTRVQDHLKVIILSFFKIKDARYEILRDYDWDVENIVLDFDLLDLIVWGIRHFKSETYLKKRFESIKYLYVCNPDRLTELNLKPYEIHVFDLVKRFSKLEEIIDRSELLEFDTLRLLYLFLTLEVISLKRGLIKDTAPEPSLGFNYVVGASSFSSFKEALKHYNLKYELIYKMLTKEIGPVALSILYRAIEDIHENLPAYLQNIELTPDGRLPEDTISKALWYHDFSKNVGEFLRGLEEILYAEIFAVKRHLGVEHEQQVLKWLNGIGN